MSAFLLFPMHGRCGSNLVAANLEPLFRQSDLELWKPRLIRRARSWGVNADPITDPVGYLRGYCERGNLVGGKLFPSDVVRLRGGDWGDGDVAVCREALAGCDGAIFMYRENLTEQFVSLQVACRDGHWAPQRTVSACEPFAVDIDAAIAEIECAIGLFVKCLDAAPRSLVLRYEQLDTASINKARKFVGLEPVDEMSSPFVKKRSEQLYRQVLTNYDEVNERMGARYGVLFGEAGTRWEE